MSDVETLAQALYAVDIGLDMGRMHRLAGLRGAWQAAHHGTRQKYLDRAKDVLTVWRRLEDARRRAEAHDVDTEDGP